MNADAGFLAREGTPDGAQMLRDVLDNLSAFVAVLDPGGKMLEVNRAPLEAAGLQRSNVIGQCFWDCPWWGWSTDAQKQLQHCIARAAAGETIRYDATIALQPEGARATLDVQIAPLRDEEGRIMRLVVSGTDITWRKNTERALQTALVRTELALEAGQTGVWEVDFLTGEMIWDIRMRNLFGIAQHDPVTQDMLDSLIHPEDLSGMRDAAKAATDPSGNGEYATEFRLRGAGHAAQDRWIAARGRCLFEHDSPIRMVGIARDITQRKQRETHVHMLMCEVQHRSKNLLAVIQAMARQSASAGGTAKDFERRFTARLEALAGAQDLLVVQDWHGASMRDLVLSQLVQFEDLIGSRIFIEGPDVMLKPQAAQNIGLALHELSTNAAKYGALSNHRGRIDLNWSIKPADESPVLCLSWRESGGPKVSPPKHEGFGHKVLKRIVANALEGKVTFDFAPGGMIWQLEIPTSYLATARLTPQESKTPAKHPGTFGAPLWRT